MADDRAASTAPCMAWASGFGASTTWGPMIRAIMSSTGAACVSRPAVSQLLKVLRDAGLVREERSGTRRLYRVEPRGIEELRRYLDGFWDDVLAAFRAEAARGSRGDDDEP